MMQKDNTRLLADFGITTPTLALDDGSVLTALDVVRYVPNRRCVCRAEWQGQDVYVKLFFGDKAEQYALRDIRGSECLQRAKLLTPQILRYSQLSQLEGRAVVFEAIAPAENAEEVLLLANESNQLALAKKVVKTVAELHGENLIQTDMYLKNFLVKHGAIYTIDGDGILLFNELPRKDALTNLSKLLSKFDVLMLNRHLSTLLEIYTEVRKWKELPDIEKVKLSVKAARYKATSAYANKKVFRQCTDVNVINTRHAFVAVRSHFSEFALPQAADELDDYITPDNIIKNGNTCTVALASLKSSLASADKLSVVIKRYNIKHFWHGVSRALRQTRAATSWGNAHRLQLLRLETADPVALIERRIFGLKRKAYFLTEYIDAPDMIAFFNQSFDKTLRAKVVKQTVQLFYRLYLLDISHGDMKASNIKVLADGKPSLIDLDSMQQHQGGVAAQKAHVRDVKRFMQNWKDQPSLYNAFVKVFKVVYADHAPLYAAQILE